MAPDPDSYSSKRALQDQNEMEADASPVAKRARNLHTDKENVPLDMSAAVARAMKGREDKKPPECGIITKIYCENFMCHRKLSVELCRNVNFIYGQNGSGKSAILAAIQICLGAGARRTHRARNLKDLVRKDSNVGYAKVQVTLLNKGDDAYKHELYGDHITVERTIATRGGYNGYKLFGANNQEVSRSKKDLDELLDRVNAQVENPVAILDQEEAKKFLTGKAEDKFAFFMKATELERIDRTIAATCDKIKELDDQGKKIELSLEEDTELMLETKKAYNQHKEIEKLERKRCGCEEAFAWAMYQEANQRLEGEQQTLEQFQEKSKNREEELTQAEAASQQDTDEIAKRNKLEDLNKEAEEQALMKRQTEQELRTALEPKKMHERNLRFLKKEEDSAERQLLNAKKRLEDKRNEIMTRAGSAESEAARRAQLLQTAEENLVTKKQKYDETKQATNDARRKYEELEPHVDEARQSAAAAERNLRRLEARVAELESSTGNSLAVFGQRCAQVHREVTRQINANRFNGPVVGPIGAYVKIVSGKEDLAPLAELAIGNGTLDRFVVTNDHDRKLLQKIRQKVGCQFDCGIFQVSAQRNRYNVPGPPVAGIETVASVLNVSNDLVFNCLVDNCRIEERALARSKEESEEKLLVNNNGQYSIRGKIKNVFFLPKGDNWSVPKGGGQSMFANEKPLRQTIGVDKTAAINAAKNDSVAVREELAGLKRDEGRLEVQHHEFQKLWNQKMREYKSLQAEINKIVEEIDGIKAEQDTAESFDTDTTDLEQDVSEAEDAVAQIKEKKTQLEKDVSDLEPSIQDIKTRLEEVTARNVKVMRDMEEASNDLTSYMTSLSQREEKLKRKRQKLEQYKEFIQKQQDKVDEMAEDVRKYLRQSRYLTFARIKREQWDQQNAEGNSAEIEESQMTQEPTEEELEQIEITEVERDSNYYRARIEKLERKIESERKRRNASNEDCMAAYEKYMRAKEKLESKMKQLDEVRDLCASLERDVNDRKDRSEAFRFHIAAKTSLKFDEILNQKGSSGTVEFDMDNRTLELCVQKDSADANSQQRDVKALSGGERSYATIALLLALGESLETPFRILDEFDVFLDSVSRKLTIESLIRMAKEMTHRQFVFITPQDISNVESDPMLKILRMLPPSRNAMAGGPSQQTLELTQGR